MDVSSFLKWDSSGKESGQPETTGDPFSKQHNAPSTLSFVQDNLSNFFNQGADASFNLLSPSQQGKRASHSSTDSASSHSNSDEKTTSSSFAGFKAKQQTQLTDMLMEKLVAMALPPTSEMGAEVIQGRVQAGKTRPGLSVPIMTKNFIQLNSRLAMPFEMIDNVIRFFSWENPTFTLTILMIYTHVVLKPLPLLSSFPFFLIITYIMTPAYTTKHQPDQHTVLGKNNPVLAEGPALKKVAVPTPAPEFSKEFILNLTDLQNHMILYVIAWDFVVDTLKKFAYYTDDSISPFFFLTLLASGISLLLFGEKFIQYVPLRLIMIVAGWAGTIAFHPYFYDFVFSLVYSEDTRLYILSKTDTFEDIIASQFDFEEPQEQKEVEMFEVQQFNGSTKEWILVFYLDNDFSKVSDARLLYRESTPLGTTSRASIKPPRDWDFVPNEDWRIDLSPDDWVRTHLIAGVVRTDNQTKWVYDTADQENKFQPHFRRRRWTRAVTRQTEISPGRVKARRLKCDQDITSGATVHGP